MQRGNTLNSESDTLLALFVVGLWSFGRVINPITHAVLSTYDSIGPFLSSLQIIYVILHVLLFWYAWTLMAVFLRKHRSRYTWRISAEFALYVYVMVTLILSVYFIAYEFGYLPPFLENLIPVINL